MLEETESPTLIIEQKLVIELNQAGFLVLRSNIKSRISVSEKNKVLLVQ
jgi:hypothetical protein